MPITTKDFAKLTDDLQSIFNEVSRTNLSTMVGPTIFDVRDTNRLTYEHLILHGVQGVEDVSEGQDYPKVSTEEGDSITYTQRQYGVNVVITKKMRKYDLHNQIDTLVRSIVDDAWSKIEQDFADTLLYGFSNSYTNVYGKTTSGLCADGKCLFNAAHDSPSGSTTFSNIINSNAPLSREAIVAARKAALTYKDPNGQIRPVILDTLVVSPTNEDLARRICESQQLSGTANNDINPLYGKIKVVVWPQLEARSDGTDTSAYWFMYDSRKVKESLKCLFGERPSLDPPEQVYENKNWEYTLDYDYVIGRGWPAYIYGSNGTG